MEGKRPRENLRRIREEIVSVWQKYSGSGKTRFSTLVCLCSHLCWYNRIDFERNDKNEEFEGLNGRESELLIEGMSCISARTILTCQS